MNIKSIFDAKQRAAIREKYNLVAVIRAGLPDDQHTDIGFESEISREIELKSGPSEMSGSGVIHVPYEAFKNARNYQRAMTGKTNVEGHIVGNGAATVATDLLMDEFINPLAARSILREAGALFIEGLRGDVSLPKGDNLEPGWVSDESALTPEVNGNFSNVNGTPHTCACKLDLTRNMVMQNGEAITAVVEKLMLDALARAVDIAALDGSGTEGAPLGLLQHDGMKSVAGIVAGHVTAANLADFLDAVEDDDTDERNVRWLAPTKVANLLRKTRDFSLVENDGEVVGTVGGERLLHDGLALDVPLIASNVVKAKTLICGDWSQLAVCCWNGGYLDLLVNPYTLSPKGAVRIQMYKDVDAVVRNIDAFAVAQVLA